MVYHGILLSSKEGNSYHFGKMFDNHWIERWGWDPLNTNKTIDIKKYQGSLIESFIIIILKKDTLENITL